MSGGPGTGAVDNNAPSMVTSGSSARGSLHPALAVLAVIAGKAAMDVGQVQTIAQGLRVALVAGEMLLVLPALVLLVLARVPIAESLGTRPVGARTAGLAALAGAALWAASLGLMNVQFVLWRPPEQFLELFRILHQTLRPSTFTEAALSLIAIALMPALCEETLFRGVVLPSCLRGGRAVALVASAALFALIHIDAVGHSAVFYRLPFAFVVGLGLGALRLLTGSLLPSVLAHAVLNTITFATVFLTGAASQAMDEPQALSGALLLLGGAAASAWALRALRR